MRNNLSIEKRGRKTPLFLTIEEIHIFDLSIKNLNISITVTDY
jgi:hypothetical protein